jgi:hypothetical protein
VKCRRIYEIGLSPRRELKNFQGLKLHSGEEECNNFYYRNEEVFGVDIMPHISMMMVWIGSWIFSFSGWGETESS